MTYSRHLSHGRRLGGLGLITSSRHLPPNMVIVDVVVDGIKAVAVEAVVVVDAVVLGTVDVAEATDTKEGDVVAVGGVTHLAASMVFIYQTATMIPIFFNRW